MATELVNLRNNTDPFIQKIDRSTIFGNPFPITKFCTRTQSIKLYREYFYERINSDNFFKLMVKSLKNKKLACWCKPLACHGDIIKEYLDNE